MPFSFLPRMIFPHLIDVTAEALRARGISFLMLDFDNTIVTYTNATFYPKMVADITTGTGTTPQSTYNPLPVSTCGCGC